MFIDFHTHRDRQSPDLINVQTLDVKANLQDLPNVCSLGLHPWFVQLDSWQQDWETLEGLANSPQVIAIGECGLDRVIDLPMEVQISIFRKHIELAESLKKPLVIHCVRAFFELITLKKRSKSTIPWVIHGFNKKLEIFQQLLDQGFYFSLGDAILSDRSPVFKAIATIPEGRFLLETDDHPDLKIEQIYERAASLRQVPVATLQAQLVKTYEQLTRLF